MATSRRRRQPGSPARGAIRRRARDGAATEPDPVDGRGLAALLASGVAGAALPTADRRRPLAAPSVVALQRTHGNAYVQRLIARQTAPVIQREGAKAQVNTPSWKAFSRRDQARFMQAHSRFMEEFNRARSFLEWWGEQASGNPDGHQRVWTYAVTILSRSLVDYEELLVAVGKTYTGYEDLLVHREIVEKKKNERRGKSVASVPEGAIDQELALIQADLEPLNGEFADFVLTWSVELGRLLDRPSTKAPRRSSVRGANIADDPAIVDQLHRVLRHLGTFETDSNMVWGRVIAVRSKIEQLAPRLRRLLG